MALHVRLLKHNLLQLARIRALPYATQVNDTFVDRQSIDHHASTGNDHRTVMTEQTHLYMSRLQHQAAAENEKSSLSNSDRLSYLLSILFNNGMPLRDNLFSSENVLSNKDYVNHEEHVKQLLPMTLCDIESILCESKGNHKDHMKIRDVNKIVKKVNYTEDDILVKEVKSHAPVRISEVSHKEKEVPSFEGSNATQVFPGKKNEIHGLDSNVVFCQGPGGTQTPPDKDSTHLPTKEQLIRIETHFAEVLPKFFREKQDFRVYHQDLVFENNFWQKSVTTRGINAYAVQMLKFRMLVQFNYTSPKMHVLKLTHHPEDGTVRVRWRVSGVPQGSVFQFWKLLPWNFRKSRERETEWHDGFSILTVSKDGIVVKHKLDRVIPDEQVEVDKTAALPLAGI